MPKYLQRKLHIDNDITVVMLSTTGTANFPHHLPRNLSLSLYNGSHEPQCEAWSQGLLERVTWSRPVWFQMRTRQPMWQRGRERKIDRQTERQSRQVEEKHSNGDDVEIISRAKSKSHDDHMMITCSPYSRPFRHSGAIQYGLPTTSV